jgi:hypothetical protein
MGQGFALCGMDKVLWDKALPFVDKVLMAQDAVQDIVPDTTKPVQATSKLVQATSKLGKPTKGKAKKATGKVPDTKKADLPYNVVDHVVAWATRTYSDLSDVNGRRSNKTVYLVPDTAGTARQVFCLTDSNYKATSGVACRLFTRSYLDKYLQDTKHTMLCVNKSNYAVPLAIDAATVNCLRAGIAQALKHRKGGKVPKSVTIG